MKAGLCLFFLARLVSAVVKFRPGRLGNLTDLFELGPPVAIPSSSPVGLAMCGNLCSAAPGCSAFVLSPSGSACRLGLALTEGVREWAGGVGAVPDNMVFTSGNPTELGRVSDFFLFMFLWAKGSCGEKKIAQVSHGFPSRYCLVQSSTAKRVPRATFQLLRVQAF